MLWLFSIVMTQECVRENYEMLREDLTNHALVIRREPNDACATHGLYAFVRGLSFHLGTTGLSVGSYCLEQLCMPLVPLGRGGGGLGLTRGRTTSLF